ncbi:MAG: flagellar biosynthesis anti-sigma factor FlgM [Lachnospiraceae bacterium]|nr:flagellar biosynthesis anti-sigma factor FlgM [Lachnospiraceae bacterium]
MRIEAYTQIQQLYQASKPKTTQTAKAPSFMDQLQISSQGKDIQAAKSAVNNAPDIREDVVAPIKEQIKNGTYEVDAESLADKLFARFQEMR